MPDPSTRPDRRRLRSLLASLAKVWAPPLPPYLRFTSANDLIHAADFAR